MVAETVQAVGKSELEREIWRLSVVGNEHVLRGIEVAATAGVNVLLVGPDIRGSRECMRQALMEIVEEGHSTIDIKALGPCPCGFLRDPAHACHCTEREIVAYTRRWQRAGQTHPLRLECVRPLTEEVFYAGHHEMPDTIGARIIAGANRLSDRPPTRLKNLNKECLALLQSVTQQFGWTGSDILLCLQVADAVAALEDAKDIAVHHLAETACYLPRWDKF